MRSDFMPRVLATVVAWCVSSVIQAAQVDIPGPVGSVSFGASVTVLPNGNFVVTDPDGPVSGIGAAYLYSPTGTLISSLYGSTANDHVGKSGVFRIGANFVVVSVNWHNGAAANAGAVTWVDGATGFVTGSTATSNVVSSANSLVGGHAGDAVGAITLLSNGNYVVRANHWNNNVGAVTWCKADGSTVGTVSLANSLTGSLTGDAVGLLGVTALSDGNYVVDSPNWSNPAPIVPAVGAATWVDGSGPFSGVVLASNSLVGTTTGDNVGEGGVVALGNGHYVVTSYNWQNGAGVQAGAVTWRSGGSAAPDTVSTGNSLYGTTNGDYVGSGGTIALSNGNYVVSSNLWGGGAGAATWGNGSTGTVGAVSEANSLVGNDSGNVLEVTALTNGKYVVASPRWDSGSGQVGAAILIDGSAAFSGTISVGNALVGTSAGDGIGDGGVTALSDGNYVVSSFEWNGSVGAATWGSGSTGKTGPVLPSNSLTGSAPFDQLGQRRALALSDGNYVVFDSTWNAANMYGAATWCRAGGACIGPISDTRSFHGTSPGDSVGVSGRAFSDGNYAMFSPNWTNNGAAVGAVTLANGRFRLKGTIAPWNSVIGLSGSGGTQMSYDYDVTRQRLIVGRPKDNVVSLFTMDQVFADDLDP